MTMRRGLALLVTVLAAVAAAADEAHYLFPTELAARVESGERGGLVVGLEPRGTCTLVTVSNLVLTLDEQPAPTAPDPRLEGESSSLVLPQEFRLPEELIGPLAGSGGDSWRTLVRVVEYVSQRVVLDEQDRGAQDVASVLTRARGRCSGRANAAVGLLRGVGIPARVVHGVVVGEGRVQVAPVGRGVARPPRLGALRPGHLDRPRERAVRPDARRRRGSTVWVASGCRPWTSGDSAGFRCGTGCECFRPRVSPCDAGGGSRTGELWAALYAPDGSRWVRRAAVKWSSPGCFPAATGWSGRSTRGSGRPS